MSTVDPCKQCIEHQLQSAELLERSACYGRPDDQCWHSSPQFQLYRGRLIISRQSGLPAQYWPTLGNNADTQLRVSLHWAIFHLILDNDQIVLIIESFQLFRNPQNSIFWPHFCTGTVYVLSLSISFGCDTGENDFVLCEAGVVQCRPVLWFPGCAVTNTDWSDHFLFIGAAARPSPARRVSSTVVSSAARDAGETAETYRGWAVIVDIRQAHE